MFETELDALDRAKLLALRVSTHRALAHARSNDAVVLAKDTFGLLRTALLGAEEGGALENDAKESR